MSTPAYHHGDLREALLRAAFDLLDSDGEVLSIRALARRANVSATAPYRHFPDKASLVTAVTVRGFDMLREAVTIADGAVPAGRAVAAQAAAYVRFALDRPALFRLMFGPQARPVSPEFERASNAAYAVLVRRTQRLYPQDREVATRVLRYWSTMHGFATLAMDGRVADKGDPEKVIVELFVANARSRRTA